MTDKTTNATPKAQFEDPHVQIVYQLLCHEQTPPDEQHWEGWVARKIVDALGGVQALSAAPAADIATVGELQAFEAWYKQDCAVAGVAAKMAAKSAWNARAALAASPIPPAEQQAQPGTVYAELPEPALQSKQCDSTMRYTTLSSFSADQMHDFADRTHALRMQAAPKAAQQLPPHRTVTYVCPVCAASLERQE